VLADSTGVARPLKQLETAGGRVITIAMDPGYRELRKQLNESDCRGVIALCGLDAMAGAWMGESFDLCRTALGVFHAMLEMRQADPARLWLVTRGAQAVGPDSASRPLAMSLWGLGRGSPRSIRAMGCPRRPGPDRDAGGGRP
jgi:hypothetical protein